MYRIHFFLLAFIFSCAGKSQTEIKNINPDKSVVCFIYHRFGDSKYPSTNVSVKDFENHLRFLTENKFQVLTLTEALNYLESDEPLRKTVVLSIDDGYKSFYENALPLLKKYKMPATLFINTETVGSNDYMSWLQLKEAMVANVEIGNHTHTHRYFLNESVKTRYATFEKEILTSQTIIADHLNVTPSIFAYPFGEFDEGMKAVVKKLNFRCAVAQYSGVLHLDMDSYQLPRFPMAEAYSEVSKFAEKASMKPLRVVTQSFYKTLLTEGMKKPELSITIENTGLDFDRAQCFVQGSDCNLKIHHDNTKAVISMQATQDITSRRRTLYTVTIPDKKGNWYWFSHLWINPKVK